MVVVGTTSSPDSLDPALRRPGRFDTEIPVPVPDGPARVHILRALAAGLGAAAGLDLDELALGCFGYSGADLAALCREAALSALGRVAGGAGEGSGMEPGARSPRQGAGSPGPREEDVVVTMEDFESARSKVVPSITRGLTLDFVPVAWDQIGGLPDIKRRLRCVAGWRSCMGRGQERRISTGHSGTGRQCRHLPLGYSLVPRGSGRPTFYWEQGL